jgi:hypothetical protein
MHGPTFLWSTALGEALISMVKLATKSVEMAQIRLLGWEFQFLVPVSGIPIGSGITILF